MSDSALAQLSAARQALAECKNVMQAKQVADAAEAARVYLERTKASADTVNEATEIRTLAEKQMGDFLAVAPKATGAAGIGPIAVKEVARNGPLTLAEMGISKYEAARAKKLASLPEGELERRIEAGKAAGKLTMAYILNPPKEVSAHGIEVITPPATGKTKRGKVRAERYDSDGEAMIMAVTWWNRLTIAEQGEFLSRIGAEIQPTARSPAMTG